MFGNGEIMSDRDLFISWLYNNDERELSNDTIIYAIELYDLKTHSVDELKEMLIKGY